MVLGSFLIAAIMAASMSSIDSGLNSVSAVLVTDYFQRLSKKRRSDEYYLRLSRILVIVLGIIVTMVGLVVHKIGKNFLETIMFTVSWFMPPVSATFFLGAVSKRVNVHGAIAAFILCPAIMIILTYATSIPAWTFMIIGMTLAFIIGYLGSFLGPKPSPENLRYTIWNMKSQNDLKKEADKQ